jgi:hypothetical protein
VVSAGDDGLVAGLLLFPVFCGWRSFSAFVTRALLFWRCSSDALVVCSGSRALAACGIRSRKKLEIETGCRHYCCSKF